MPDLVPTWEEQCPKCGVVRWTNQDADGPCDCTPPTNPPAAPPSGEGPRFIYVGGGEVFDTQEERHLKLADCLVSLNELAAGQATPNPRSERIELAAKELVHACRPVSDRASVLPTDYLDALRAALTEDEK